MDATQELLTGGPAAVLGFVAGLMLVALPVIIAALVLRQRHQRRAARLLPALRRNERIVEASGEGLLELDRDGRVTFANPSAARMLGYTTEELVGLSYHQLIDAPRDERISARQIRHTTDIRRGVGAALKRKDGRRRPVEYRMIPLLEDGVSIGMVLAFADVSDRVHLDTMLNDTQVTAHVGGWDWDLVSGRLSWTDEVYRIHELPVGRKVQADDLLQFFDPDDRELLRQGMQRARATGEGFDFELCETTAKGNRRWVRVIGKAAKRGSEIVRLHGTYQDITDRKAVELQLRQMRDFYQRTLDALPVGVAYLDRGRKVTFCNQWFAGLTNTSLDQVVGRSLEEVIGTERYAEVAEHVDAVLRGDVRSFVRSAVVHNQQFEWRFQYVPQKSSAGEVHGFLAIATDLTEFRRLEEHLLRAQKMQAIGQLTGGIAHDFNNLLGIVMGNLQLLERSLGNEPLMARKVRTAMRAAMRGADLTRRLLAFARRQMLDPVVLDLKHLLTGLGELMQRALGESIEIRTYLAADLWNTKVDPSQLENAILNLAINARDAMPQGGKLKLEARNVKVDETYRLDHPQLEPGDYVSITVTDTGCGITPENLQRVFEPFFTTKEHGKGSGLGLPMVHGFAEQSGGVAMVQSEVGRGTTVTLLLPRSIEDRETGHEDTIVEKSMPGGNETILIVEDDADLRETVVAALSQLGYRTLEAATADEALDMLRGGQIIDLLFTDVMMPGGMLGPALAQRARELRPGLRILFTTGYAESAVLASGSGVAASDVIGKPYRNEDLALRIRQVMDRESKVA